MASNATCPEQWHYFFKSLNTEAGDKRSIYVLVPEIRANARKLVRLDWHHLPIHISFFATRMFETIYQYRLQSVGIV
jgi:hypothetical protein